MSPPRNWRPEEVPQSFWNTIAEARGDRERFRQLVSTWSPEQLHEAFDQYLELAHQLFTEKHLVRMGPDVSEDAWMDVANWVVMQGQDFYWEVFSDPEKTPSCDVVRGPSFASVLIEVYNDRFGPWTSA